MKNVLYIFRSTNKQSTCITSPSPWKRAGLSLSPLSLGEGLGVRSIKQLFFTFLILLCASSASAQDSSNKAYLDAKAQLINMLSGAEKPSYEKAIYTIENAWYNNQIRYDDFDSAMNFHTQNIQRLYKANYNEAAIKEQPSLLISKEQLLVQYKKALTNWAIYTYITQPTLYADSSTFFIHHKYKYTYADPMATNNWENTQVIYLNNNKQGNCFALASLFKILADRLQSEAQLCTAPSHIYIAHEDEKGTMYNVELGSKNFPGTGMISAITYSTDQAIENNIAQRKLSPTQQVTLALVYLAKGYQHKYNNNTDSFLLQCANAALQHDPKNLNALLLKAEWLENRLQTKNIAEVQATQDFQAYENLLAQLYKLGYREMPLEMKNNIIRLYNKEKLEVKNLNVIAKNVGHPDSFGKAISITPKATLSWGLFDERHSHKTSERYGNTIFNTRTKKITAFATGQNLYNNYNFDPVVFAMNVDPLAHKFPWQSPYSAFGGNPIYNIDVAGAFQYPGDKAAAYRKSYPMITKYLSQNIQRDILKDQKILDAYEKHTHGNLDRASVVEKTTWNKGPEIRFVENPGFIQNGAKGYYEPYGDYIELNSKEATRIEKILQSDAPDDVKMKALTPFYKTVVHENGHSGNYKNYEKINKEGEVGVEIERDVWGDKNYNPDFDDMYEDKTTDKVINEQKQLPADKQSLPTPPSK